MPITQQKLLSHSHFICSAYVNKPISCPIHGKEWMKNLVDLIDMELMAPISVSYSNKAGNRGLTIAALITTSHIVAHFWDEEMPAKLELDIYSCKPFSHAKVQKYLKKLDLEKLQYKILDRTNGLKDLK